MQRARRFGGTSKLSRSIQSKFELWPEETHGTVVLRSVYEGLRWLHEPFYTSDPMRVYEESGLPFFDKRYERISQYLGYEMKVPERILMEIQHQLREQHELLPIVFSVELIAVPNLKQY